MNTKPLRIKFSCLLLEDESKYIPTWLVALCRFGNEVKVKIKSQLRPTLDSVLSGMLADTKETDGLTLWSFCRKNGMMQNGKPSTEGLRLYRCKRRSARKLAELRLGIKELSEVMS